jgi:predicted metalloprotease with PDZ domain
LNGSNIFMLVPGREKDKHIVKVNPLSTWAKISVALPSKSANTYEAANYDLLADSPFEIGNHQIIEFDAAGVKHSVAMVGPGNYDAEKIKTDFTKIVQEAKSIFGTHPCSEYLFIVHNVAAGGGGLEHLNSTTVQVNRFAYSNENTYRSFLGLIAHEYFHLWNVKRLRPAALGPFNYSEENYTTMLWVAEGFTAFYDNWIVRRAGLMNTDKYLEIVANEYSAQSNLPGDKVQALAEASFDSWIKYYRRNENSNNTQVSYYDKGSIVASLMNLMIIKNSNGQNNLDDLMRFLYNEYYQKQGRGYTDEEFKKAAENLCGQSLDDFYAKYINGTEVIPYAVYLELAGLKLINLNAAKEEPYLGLGSSIVNGKLLVTSVANGSPAYKAGLSVNDELIAMDNYRIDDLTKFMALKKPNDKVSLVYARDGMLFNTDLQIEKNSAVKYKIDVNPDSKDEVLRKKWLY